MQRRTFISQALGPSLLAGWACAHAAWLSEGDAAAGIRAALERGALSAVGLLGRQDGFLGNPQVRIPLPGSLNEVARVMKAVGQQRRVEALETAMNRAAEAAVPEAKGLLVNAVKGMSIEDAKRLLGGGERSVTEFFEGKTREPLGIRFLPIVTRATEKVALADKYNAVAGKAAGLGLLKQQDASIQSYVTGKALDGLYLMIGEEEKKIRENPVATGSALLKKVFGSLK